MKNKILLCFLSLIMLASCKSNTDNTDKVVTDETPKNKYTLSAFTSSTPYPDATLTLTGYSDGKFDFNVESESYTLGTQTPDAPAKMCANSDKGQHIHLIVGTDPYIAKYTSEFDQEVRDGEHNMLAFISRSYHESIKTPTAYTAQKATVKDNAITTSEPITGEMMFYSRPKGTYVGKANTDKVMLDFYLVNSQLNADRKIIANINGEEHTIEKWQPYYIEGMPIGKNKITLTLVDKSGTKIDIPHNPVTREFELKEDPADNIQ